MTFYLNEVLIRNKKIEVPIIQGGMGIGISLSGLATAVINEGGMGTLSLSQIGFNQPDFWQNHKKSCEAKYEALKSEVKKIRANTKPTGFLAVNILSASRDYANLAKNAVEAGVDAIVSGAGLPIDLPKYTKGTDTANVPIVASSRVLNIIVKKWKRKYGVLPDAVIVEGPEAGGHLGIKYEDIGKEVTNLSDRLIDVKDYMNKNELDFPVFVAGGVYSHEDVKHFVELGASGVQLGTRFIATKECDVHEKYKQKFIDAQKSDIVHVKSPVGYPARAIKNEFTKQIEKANILPKKCIACILPCKGKNEETPYCISQYLSSAANGDTTNGLVFTGANGYRINEITTVHQLFNELLGRNNE